MKKLFVLLFSAILVLACTSVDDTNTCKEEIIEKSTYLEVKPLKYKGHRYLWFRTKRTKGFGGIAHDPNCDCMK